VDFYEDTEVLLQIVEQQLRRRQQAELNARHLLFQRNCNLL
jgi:hypothetical protein